MYIDEACFRTRKERKRRRGPALHPTLSRLLGVAGRGQKVREGLNSNNACPRAEPSVAEQRPDDRHDRTKHLSLRARDSTRTPQVRPSTSEDLDAHHRGLSTGQRPHRGGYGHRQPQSAFGACPGIGVLSSGDHTHHRLDMSGGVRLPAES